jgi:DNA-binding CsgD family transcriptional regulator
MVVPGADAAGIVEREREFALLERLLDTARTYGGLLLSGEPGIGKTTLWEAGIASARHRHWRVLAARPSRATSRASFAGLADLLDDVDVTAHGLPAPQAHALDAALLRAEPSGAPAETHVIGLGAYGLLRVLAADAPLLLAVDDLQWLDRASAETLVFAYRRLDRSGVAWLLARRPGPASELERLLGRRGLARAELGPLGLDATRRLLHARLGLTLPRAVLVRIATAARGNPLFALELGRAAAEHGSPRIDEEITLPDDLEELLGLRVARLPAGVRRALHALALGGELRTAQLAAIVGDEALEDALARGVLLREGDSLRAAHPLLAAAAARRRPTRERRALHAALAAVALDEQRRVAHEALAAAGPDDALARRLEHAAAAAFARGARPDAAVLAGQALRLTSTDSPTRPARVLAFAEYLDVVGERRRLTEFVNAEYDRLPPGRSRAVALLFLVSGAVVSNDEIRSLLARALQESGDDDAMRTAVLAQIAENDAVVRVERLPDAEERAMQALEAAERSGDSPANALHVAAWAVALRGRPIAHLCERFRLEVGPLGDVSASPERIAGQRHVWRGELVQARAVLAPLLRVADERGEPVAYALVRLHLCELELRAGAFAAAEKLLDEWVESGDHEWMRWPMYERCRALSAAGRGQPREAERWARTTIAQAERKGVRWDLFEAQRAVGQAALLRHDAQRAADALRPVWAHTQREGVDDPGVFPVAPDLVEALIGLDARDEAASVTGRLEQLADRLDHPWARAGTARSRGLLAAAAGDVDTARELIGAAADAYDAQGLRFDHARALLLLGRCERRARRWGAARDTLETAATVFDAIGSTGWAQDTRSELARISGRRPVHAGQLSPTEQRVVELAAHGRANKEIAADLFISVHTVELHLSHAYRKLGIRSRTQLARRLTHNNA